jgi:tetratricopeptide (TPR) repeat protein
MSLLVKRIVLAVTAPAFLLVCLEILLGFAGFGVPSRLYAVAEWNGENLATENLNFTRKYFGPRLERAPWHVAFPVPKPPGEFRVFLLGESAALGDPIPEFGLARMIEVLLQDAMPDRRVRVINSAITAINSHVILEISREIIRYEPDAVVVYMGNNEVVGPFGPGTVFPAVAESPRLIRVISLARSTRTGQAIEALAARIRPPPFKQWQGMEMFLDRQVAPDDPRLATTRRMFEANLEAICSTLHRKNIPVVLATVAVNLRDCAPLASPPPDHEANRFFLAARMLDQQGHREEATRHYRAAMEADALRFRADTAINQAIRRVAARRVKDQLTLVDAERIIEDASPGRIPGETLFYDHVHLNFRGQYLVASHAAAAIAQHHGRPIAGLSEEEVARQLGWTPWSEKEAFGEMYSRRLRPPFSDQLDRAEVERRWAERLIDHDLSCREQCLNAARDTMFQSLEKRGLEDSNHWKNLADLEVKLRRPDRAADAFGQAARLLPHHAGRLVMAQAAALAVLDADRGHTLIKDDQRFSRWPEDRIWSDLGSVLVEWGWAGSAERLFHQAWLLNPENPDALVNLGVSRAVAGRPAEAIAMLRKAVDIKPRDDVAWANLGRALFESGDKNEGIAAMEKSVGINPLNGLTRSALAVMYFREGNFPKAREHFDAAMIEAPLDAVLLADAARLAVSEKDFARAGELQARAARLSPADAYSQYLAGQLLLQTERRLEAVANLRTALRLAPGQTAWRANLIWILATHPDASLRDPEKALALAEDFPEDPARAWMKADLKAAALAAGGRTDDAAEWLGGVDAETIPEEFRENIIARLALYREGWPYVAGQDEFVPK